MKIYIVGRQIVDDRAVQKFLDDQGLEWKSDAASGAEALVEMGGRVCYTSFGKGRKTNKEYIDNLVGMKHGSVLEHATWDFIITGVSRSFSHELVRHRAGWAYSQVSQRYVDASSANFIEPAVIAKNEFAHIAWLQATELSRQVYRDLAEELTHGVKTVDTRSRKLIRQAARSVLPNATETMVFCTANARALRHFIELRGSAAADTEIRTVALGLLKLLRAEAPVIFGDYEIVVEDGIEVARTVNTKV